MTIETVEIEGQDYKFALLELKDGQQMITLDGRLISSCFLAVMGINSMEEKTSYQEDWTLGVWETVDKYKASLKNQAYSASVNHFPLRFNGGGQSVPISVLNHLNFNLEWLYGREISEAFLNIILSLPDGTGGTYGDRYKIY